MNLLHRLEPGAREYMLRLLRDGGKPLSELSVAEARQSMSDSQPTQMGDASVTSETVTAASIPLTIVRPALAREALPAVLYLHGGGWVLGGIETHVRIVRELALRTHAAVVFPHYTRAPEARFPVAVEQCYAAARWVQLHEVDHPGRPEKAIDGTRFAIAGDSAGGNLAAAVALQIAQHGDPSPRLQALICPALAASFDTDSYAEFADDMNLTRADMEWFWNHYAPDAAQRLTPAASPLQAKSADLARVAPAIILTAECDVLRDEGEQYAHQLAAAGVAVTAIRFLGTVHNFPVIDDLQQTGPAISALQILADALRAALHA